MSPPTAWGILLGLVLGCGAWLAVVRLPAMRQTSFAERVAPQLRAGRTASRLLELDNPALVSPFGPLGRILGPVLRDAVAWVNRLNPLGEALVLRLQKAGLDMTVADFRASQLAWAAGGFLLGGGLVLLSTATGSFNGLLAVVLPVAGAGSGFALREWYLGEQALRRGRRILGQFPTIAELMALAIGAGEGTVGALERVCHSTRGDLADEFRATLADVHAGLPLGQALRALARRVDLPAMTRFVDAIAVATERGTPLAQVMRDQAQDVRDSAKRELMETAGKKEIGMMVPVVFGILPLTIVFAVYPGISAINLNY
jgi:tight adherence protein C